MKQYLIISFSSILFILLLVSIYFKNISPKPIDLPVAVAPSPTVSRPTPSVNLTAITVANKANTFEPLFAYLDKTSNLFIYNTATKQESQVTKNGSISAFHWSKDGQYLYWMAKYLVDQNTYNYTFGRGKFPDFKVDIFLDADSHIYGVDNDIYDFVPIVKNNSIVVAAKKGLFLVSNINQRVAASNNQLIKYNQVENMAEGIYDSYSIQDIDPQENNLLLNYCVWEGCPDTGYLNISRPKFISLPKIYGGTVGYSMFSPSGKKILIGGGENEMVGGNTQESVLTFPGLKTVFQIGSVADPDTVGGASFIDDNTIALYYGMNQFADNKKIIRTGISIFDIQKNNELSFTELQNSTFKDETYHTFGISYSKPGLLIGRTNYFDDNFEYLYPSANFKTIEVVTRAVPLNKTQQYSVQPK